ncbi:MAG TPA: histidine phosphatase family protein [Candidatus Paceibacterota bacterium]|nr:histidine phosphatase family protein [Verrucomicrobiota bacterium]HRY49393.1 histidine phosphatase family protein [Candidatus Paceibacterota bacterium]HSA02970.1 histidine phosphatase family protein [Candidatus Paceibacterota bacterium]
MKQSSLMQMAGCVFILWLAGVAVCQAQPSRIVLIRHAEKPTNDEEPHLSDAGRQRAIRLIDWVANDPLWGTNPPVALFAAQPKKWNSSIRSLETLEPLAKHLRLEIQMPCVATDYHEFANLILKDRSLANKTVLVCWVNDYLPALAGALGVKPEPPDWKSKDFNSVYVITYTKGMASFRRTKQFN